MGAHKYHLVEVILMSTHIMVFHNSTHNLGFNEKILCCGSSLTPKVINNFVYDYVTFYTINVFSNTRTTGSDRKLNCLVWCVTWMV